MLSITLQREAPAVERTWQRLALYESWDLCKQHFKKRHGRTLSTEKAREVSCHFAHGRAYFTSARNAAETVKPLLLYYGVLALTRGLILYLDALARESSLGSSHGVGVDGWQQCLARGLTHLPELRVETHGKGTFAELLRVTRNTEIAVVYTVPAPAVTTLVTKGSSELPTTFRPSLKELLGRIPELCELFERTFGHHAMCYPAIVWIAEYMTDVAVLPTSLGLPSELELRSALSIPAEIRVSQSNQHFLTDKTTLQYRYNTGPTQVPEHQIRAVTDSSGSMYVVAPFPGNVLLSSLVVSFLTSFSLGMLVRYYPTHWTTMISGSSGDLSVPLLKAAVSYVEDRFPELILNELD